MVGPGRPGRKTLSAVMRLLKVNPETSMTERNGRAYDDVSGDQQRLEHCLETEKKTMTPMTNMSANSNAGLKTMVV